MRSLTYLILVTGLALLVGCECAPRADQVTPPDVDDAEPVAAEDFARQLVDAGCDAYRSCQDDRFRGGIFHLFLLPVGTSFDDGLPPEVVDEYRDTFQHTKSAAEAETPPMLPDQHCEEFTEMVTAFLGMQPHQIEEALQRDAAEYDPEAAGQCIERIRATPSPCQQERGARGDDFNMQQYAAIATRHRGELQDHYEPCERVFTGNQLEERECSYVYECAEGNCEWFSEADTGVCGPDRRDHWLIP